MAIKSDLDDQAPVAMDHKCQALQGMLRLYADPLEAYVRHKLPVDLRNLLDPHDVLQDVFFEAFRRIEEFEPRVENAAYAWLITIARHRIFALIRAHRNTKKRGSRTDIAVALSEVESILEELAVYSRTPSQSAISHEVVAVIQKSLSSLKPQFREAIQLRYIVGLSAEESAQQMGRTQAAVFMLCRRGLKTLRANLLEAGAFSNA